jgi:hypothetical protein
VRLKEETGRGLNIPISSGFENILKNDGSIAAGFDASNDEEEEEEEEENEEEEEEGEETSFRDEQPDSENADNTGLKQSTAEWIADYCNAYPSQKKASKGGATEGGKVQEKTATH